ncbi:MAG: cobalamin-dependent protein, partial [Clostridia bacterium]|nr:cobalamin-dependent protein [Clostridia bacterium]
MNKNLNVGSAGAAAFKSKSDLMLDEVNHIMKEKNLKFSLIGNNPISVMLDNHRNHINFMTSLFTTNDYSMLDKTMPWILNTYLSKGFTKSYFSHVLNTWMEVISKNISSTLSEEILAVYKYMLEAIENDRIVMGKDSSSYNSNAQKLARLLINGKHIEAMEYVRTFVKDRDSLMQTYMGLIQPAMYIVGDLWEKNEITVSHEHLATSLVMRIMSSFYEEYVLVKPSKYKIIIAASVNEYHEIGARIVADFLEMNGYDIRYLGANVPIDDLIKIIAEEKPYVLGISVSMSYNIGLFIEVLKSIRNYPGLKDLKIIAGGHAFSYA